MSTQNYDVSCYMQLRCAENKCSLASIPFDTSAADVVDMLSAVMENRDAFCTGLGFFLFEGLVQTHQKAYWDASKRCWERFRSSLRGFDDLILPQEPSASCLLPNGLPIEAYYASLPFIMMWESRCNGKENYNEMMHHFSSCAEAVKENFEQCSAEAIGYYLLMLADSINYVSVEVYEKHRFLIDLLREGIGMAQRRSAENFSGEGAALIAAAVYKACRCGWIHTESHRFFADSLTARTSKSIAYDLALSEKALLDNAQRRGLA